MSLKILALSAAMVVAAVSSSHAEGLGGFYIGGQAGGSFSQTKYEVNDGPGGLVDIDLRGNSSSMKPVVGAMMGYNYILKKSFLLGAELGIDSILGGDTVIFRNRFELNPGTNYSAQFKRKGPGYYALAKFGVMISDCTAVILGVGVKSAKSVFTIKDDGRRITKEMGKRSAKLHLLAGVEGLFKGSKHVGWRASYTFTQGQTVEAKSFPTGHILNNPGAYARFKRTEHQALAGVFWKF